MYSVCVLMSTYNGEKYLDEQIKSLYAQKDVKIHLIVRDDGSTDSTLSILEKYKDIQIISGRNMGCEKSFMYLLHYKYDADYYAFADQDDIWMPDKIKNEIKLISEIKGPALAGCNLSVCDENLRVIKNIHTKQEIERLRKRMKEVYFSNMHGCVLLWNRDLHKILQEYIPVYLPAHDVWVCVVANAVGQMRISDEALILYRIHDNNTAGYAGTAYRRLKKALKIYWGRNHPQRDRIAREVLLGFKKYVDINSSGYKTLQKIANYKKNLWTRIVLLRDAVIQNSKKPDKYFWILSVLFGKF